MAARRPAASPTCRARATRTTPGRGNSVHDWSVKVSETTLEKRYPGIGDLKKIKVTSREGGGDWNGRVWNVTLVGGSASKVVTGSDLRSIYGLRSTYFTFR